MQRVDMEMFCLDQFLTMVKNQCLISSKGYPVVCPTCGGFAIGTISYSGNVRVMCQCCKKEFCPMDKDKEKEESL